MLKNKKIILTIMTVIIILIIILIILINIISHNQKKQNHVEENNIEEQITMEELENQFDSLFMNIKYDNNDRSIINTYYNFNKKGKKYSVKVNIPKINIETNVVKEINNKILNNYGKKLIEIVKNSKEYTTYEVDYITFINDNKMSLIIRTMLKEGKQPTRKLIETYNYDMEKDKIIKLEDLLKMKQLDQNQIQNEIINQIRKKSENTKELANMGYNIYVRDVRSEKYLIPNIETYFLGDNSKLYLIFAYGNQAFTEETDILAF